MENTNSTGIDDLKVPKREITEPGLQADSPEKKKSSLRENVEAILIAIVLALFIRTFVVQAFKIPSGSMKETLQIGDHILVNKFAYGIKFPYLKIPFVGKTGPHYGKTLIPLGNPERGDIIVFKFPEDPEKDFIKRVIGVAGDVIQARNKKVSINSRPVEDAYAIHTDNHTMPRSVQPRDNFGPVTVPEGKVFVMGDNRDHSYDSRFWGFVDLDALKGKAFIIYWSWDKVDFGVRWSRLATLLK
jgi:signal peptidase I